MILRLRRRLTLLVTAVLVIVTAGIILSISWSNYRSIDRRAYAALNVLAENRGRRPGLQGRDSADNGADAEDVSPRGAAPSMRRIPGRRPRLRAMERSAA